MTEKPIKDINIGDLIRIKGMIYKVEGIQKSPWILHNGIDMFNFDLKFVERDLGEALADLGEIKKECEK
ncbi:MAG: hypothetical protein PHH48_06380 [Eubacteriales bacterium]|nr:hypothetical protein [Eubacteriales bacterium]